MNKSDKPHIVFVFSDQQHWRAWGGEDGFFRTPAMDALAADAVVFERAFCTTPQCSPSRSSLMTGLYPSQTGIWGNCEPGMPQLEMATIATALKAAGYRTGYFGKWHLGARPSALDGWDVFSMNDDKTRAIRQSGRHPDDVATDEATAWLESAIAEDDTRPVAIFLSIIEPHDIYRCHANHQVPDYTDIPMPESWHEETFEGKPFVHKQFMLEDQGSALPGEDETAWTRYHDCYRRNVANFDRCLGRVLETVRKLDIYDDSAIAVTSDHGDMDTAHRLIFKGPFMYEHMLRVPLIMRLPERFGGVNGRRCECMTVNVDVPATLLALAGSPGEAGEGLSLADLLRGGRRPVRDFIVAEYYRKQRWVNPIRTLRTDRYKYNLYRDGVEEFYDLQSDPHELTNLAVGDACPPQREQLAGMLRKWMADHNDPFDSQQPTDREGTVIEA